MSETNVTELPKRITSLDGWWFVDTPDGRRRLGEVEHMSDDGRDFDFKRCVEFDPISTTTMLVPSPPNPLNPQGGVSLQNMRTDGSLIATPCGLPTMPGWKVRGACGSFPAIDLPGHVRESLLVGLQKTEKACAEAAHEAARTKMKESSSNGPREKVR